MNTFQTYLQQTQEIGYVQQMVQTIAYVSGLPYVTPSELIYFESGEVGQVLSLGKDVIEVLLFSNKSIKVGTKATRTKTQLQIPVGLELLGQTIDPLGDSLDHLKPIKHGTNFREIDSVPLDITYRKRISKSFDTGVSLIDMLIPLGVGQRELVIGDRKTGKTIFLLQCLLTQARAGTLCIYAAIGKRKMDIKKVEEFCVRSGIMKNTTIMATTSEDSPGLIHLTPYAAMSLAEYFRDLGHDVLLVLDDLLSHAKFYREISLLARRFPGRNSYPGDIFYVHARLLERAGNFKTAKGENAITCLPIVETSQGDLTGYIQTNLMSMTDGHIFFDNDLFGKGRRPAINPFLSVSRVGRQTQTQSKRDITRELTSFLTLFDKMQSFVHFGAEVNQNILSTLDTGNKILAFFDQTSDVVIPSDLQIFLFCLLWIGIWQNTTTEVLKTQMAKIMQTYATDQKLQATIHEMITSSTSFNNLLNKIREQAGSLLVQINAQVAKETK